ncbi:hypothetical protein FHS25_006353 [Rhizobium laguerreae]|uniref:Uncharacterized protein n=2 Tax=Rhizobium TaxID=379 RepID=A0AAX2QBT6_9HYPH|nr:hypothetical protein [Rhizobium laguerreae]TCU05383.1 hypothetical protein EV132_13510 [Rhizobium sullae]TCU15033.1 hypothetical protein EV131_12047 [Rhizobium laguerreae]
MIAPTPHHRSQTSASDVRGSRLASPLYTGFAQFTIRTGSNRKELT